MSASTTNPRRSLSKDVSGVALIEFALLAPILVLMLANLVDFSRLIWAQMQLDYSAQIGAQAAFKACADTGNLPATTNCPTLTSAVSQAIQSSPLGANVSLSAGYPAENYSCSSGTTLVSVGTPSSPPNPFDCSSVGNSGVTPGDYIQVDVGYAYAPLFTKLSLASARTLSGQALQRLQ